MYKLTLTIVIIYTGYLYGCDTSMRHVNELKEKDYDNTGMKVHMS